MLFGCLCLACDVQIVLYIQKHRASEQIEVVQAKYNRFQFMNSSLNIGLENVELFKLERIVSAEAFDIHRVFVVSLALVVTRVHLRGGIYLHLTLDVVRLVQVLVQLTKGKAFSLLQRGIEGKIENIEIEIGI